jgi:hypothetical protein
MNHANVDSGIPLIACFPTPFPAQKALYSKPLRKRD